MPPKKAPPILKKILGYISLAKLCPCIDRRIVFIAFAWAFTAFSFTTTLIFLRSVDEDMDHSQIVVFKKLDNNTVLYAAKGGLNLRAVFKLRKITILLDFGMLLLIDFISHILLMLGVIAQRADLVMQWMTNTTVWLVLTSSASFIKFNPNPEGVEGKVIGGATLVLCKYFSNSFFKIFKIFLYSY